MSNVAQNSYLEMEVLSATPQRLRLLLLDGALRFAHRALAAIDAGDVPLAGETLDRCQAIVAELLAAIRTDRAACERIVDGIARSQAVSPEERQREIDALVSISRTTAGVCLFMFGQLSEARLQHDREKVLAVVRVLEVERETAVAVCEQLADAPQLNAANEPREISSSEASPLDDSQRSTYAPVENTTGEVRRSFSFEA